MTPCAARTFAAALVFTGAAASQPLPPRAPNDLYSPPSKPEGADEDRRACLARLTALGVEYESLTRHEEGACVIDAPIRLEAVAASRGAGTPITFPQRPMIECRLAERLADWLRDAVAPLFHAEFGAALTSVVTGPGYECRRRNRAPDSKMSAHALGLALDISAFKLSNRRSVYADEPDDQRSKNLFDVVRRTACGWFTTVLGPGSPDGFHEDHLHVDLQPHGARDSYRICQ
jgi:hypothetical protein